MLVGGFGLHGAVVASLPVPETVIVVGHDVGKIQKLTKVLDVVSGLTDLVNVSGQ